MLVKANDVPMAVNVGQGISTAGVVMLPVGVIMAVVITCMLMAVLMIVTVSVGAGSVLLTLKILSVLVHMSSQ